MPFVAFAWFRPDQWTRIRAIISDGYRIPERFEDWQRKASSQISQLEQRGMVVRKMVVDPDELLAWARSCGRSIDSQARADFAAILLTKEMGTKPN